MGHGARVRALAPWLLLAVVGTSASAHAQEAATTLVLIAPEGCATEGGLEDEVASLVGRPAAEILLPQGLDARVTITAEGASFILRVEDADGARTLRDGSCAALVRAAALIIALRVDADAATLAAAAAAEPENEPEPPAPPPAPRPAPRFRVPVMEWAHRLPRPGTPDRLPLFSLGVGGFVEAGSVPVISASFAVDVVVRVERFELRVRGSYVAEQGQEAVYGVAASAVLATLLGCGRPFDATFPLAFCGGVETGTLFAHSYGVTVSGASTNWTVAGVVGLWLPLIPWPGIDISLGAEAWVRFYRPEFAIDGIGPVWDPGLFGGRFGLLVHFTP